MNYASIDWVITTMYDVISGPAGQKRDWDRMRSLFAPGARLIPTGKRPDGSAVMMVWTVDQYISAAGASLEKDGFFEKEIGRHVDRYGDIVQVFSSYESKHLPTDVEAKLAERTLEHRKLSERLAQLEDSK